MLASFADFAAYAVRLSAGLTDTSIPTVSLSTEFLRPVKLGDWVEARAEVTKRGRNLLFSRVIASVTGRAVFTSTGIFSIGPEDNGGLKVLNAARAL
jgi:acyl-coenzyme A thioesterase PaaI-like protein